MRGPLLLVLLLAAALPAAPAAGRPAAPKPTAVPAPPPRRAPLDFSGVWELDERGSRNVPSNMRAAVLSVTQAGNRIRIEPIQEGKHILLSADQIVADGRTYEKNVGLKTRGYVTAAWSPDRASLRLEITAGPDENPRESVQRSVWTLSKDRKVWVRQSVSAREGKTSTTRLVFRRRAKK